MVAPRAQLRRQRLLEFLDPLERDRDLGVDDRVDQCWPAVERIGELRLRPLTPPGILGEEVEQHV